MRILKVVWPLVLLLSVSAMANPWPVDQVEVDGLQRISTEAFWQSAGVSQQGEIKQGDIAPAIKSLYASGYFQDVTVEDDGGILRIVVREYPTISSLEFEGNKQIKDDQLEQVLQSFSVQEGAIFNPANSRQIETELETYYRQLGKLNAEIRLEQDARSRNRVALKLMINEGADLSLQSVTFIGNEAFSDDDLLQEMKLKTPKTAFLVEKMLGANKYSEQQLIADLQNIQSHYRDNGYLQARILDFQTHYSLDGRGMHVFVTLEEGIQYQLGNFAVNDQSGLYNQELQSLLNLTSGENVSGAALGTNQQAIKSWLGERGYLYAKVDTVPDFNDEQAIANIAFIVTPGMPQKIRRVLFEGNVAANQQVLRREVLQLENSVARLSAIRQSTARIQRLGYFKNVSVDTQRVAGSADLIDLVFSVEDDTNTSIQASAGYTYGSGGNVSFELSQNNFLGTGNDFALKVDWNFGKSTNFSLTHEDYYFTPSGISRSISLYYNVSSANTEQVSNYLTNEYGAMVSFGYPTVNGGRVRSGLSYGHTDLVVGTSPNQEVSFFTENQGSEYDVVEANFSYSFSSLNSQLSPTDGTSSVLSADISLPGSDISYYKLKYSGDYYQPLPWNTSLRLHSSLAYGGSYGATQSYPFFMNFYSGGVRSVRGYENSSLGAPATLNDGSSSLTSLGGNLKTEMGLEWIFPIPLLEEKDAFRTSLFVDGGRSFQLDCVTDSCSNQERFALDQISWSAGIDISWFAIPILPISFVIATPINMQEGDAFRNTQFNIGLSY